MATNSNNSIYLSLIDIYSHLSESLELLLDVIEQILVSFRAPIKCTISLLIVSINCKS